MTYDVIVIGGGAAGLSGAVVLGRSLRSVLVIDSGSPRNAPADGIHNYLTRDGISPADFVATARAEVRKYGGEIVEGEVVSAAAGFEVTLADGRVYGGRRLLVTTGLTDELPDIPGLAERWGKSVVHCPYCHGYEIRGKRIGVIGVGDLAAHQLRMWRHWSPDVLLFDTGDVAEIDDKGVRLKNGSFVERDNVVVGGTRRARAGFLADLGLEAVDHASGIATYVPSVDPTGRTAVPGVWVAGNVTDPNALVVSAASAGAVAATMINFDLLPPE